MKKTLLLLSSIFTLGGTVLYTPTVQAQLINDQTDANSIEVIEELFVTDDAQYTFKMRGSAELKEGNTNDSLVFWVFELENISDEPIDVWFTAMNDMEIKMEDEYTITDLEDDDIYQVEITDEKSFKSVDSRLSDIDLKPGGKISILYQGQYSSKDNKDVYLEFAEWFNSENTGIIRPHGYEEANEE